MKWLLRIGLVVVLLVVVAAVAGFILIDNIATAAVQKGAAFATETDVTVEKVDVQVFGSTAQIINLDIANPDGDFAELIKTFPEEYQDVFNSFLILGNGTAQITVGKVMSDKIEIDKVELSDIQISLIGKDGVKNYEVILESLKRFQGDTPPKETEGQKQVVIKELIIRNITVYYYFDEDPALGAIAVGPKKIIMADDEPMILTDVGSGGVPMSQITADIITDIMIQVTANLAGDLGGHIKGLAGSLVDTIGEGKFGETLGELGLGDSLDSLGDLGIDLGDGVIEGGGDVIKGAGDVIGGILGGNKDKEEEEEEEGAEDKKEEGKGLLDNLPF
ncbi:MAG: hypothetical protein AB8C95_15280 [Phycisphaeraceae bacterium]